MSTGGHPVGRLTAAFQAIAPGADEPGRGFRAFQHRLATLGPGPESPPTLLFADLDGFSRVADALGPERTAQVIDEVASRLHRVVRGRDAFAHLGWDGFCVLLVGPAHPVIAEDVGRRMLSVVAEPILVPEGMVNLTICLAVVLADERDDTWSLLGKADQAMDRAKALGPGSLVRHQP